MKKLLRFEVTTNLRKNIIKFHEECAIPQKAHKTQITFTKPHGTAMRLMHT